MKPGDMVRIRFTKLLNSKFGGPHEHEEWWEEGCILVEYHTWEKIATVLHNGEIKRVEISDVQLASRC
ncbi:MAG: hypothetical protein H8E12_19665 [Rhodobacteraceae bacterium]|nr:hypothetical protein [Paracoccaceae bacterium]